MRKFNYKFTEKNDISCDVCMSAFFMNHLKYSLKIRGL